MIKDYHGLYTIGLSIKGKEIELDPSAFAFSMIDSISSFYSRGTFVMHDVTGVMSESFVFVPGMEVVLTLGIKDAVLKNTYVVEKGPQQDFNPDNLSGVIRFNLIHKSKYQQTKKSRSFSDRISGVIRNVVAPYNFKELVINDTGNNSKWYQTLQTDAKFIMDVLLPHAYANNADNTPFYAFIDSLNRFHFQSIKGMMEPDGSSKFTYVYHPNADPSKNYNVILQMKYLGSKEFVTRKTFFEFDPSTGEVAEEEFSLKQLKQGSSFFPLTSAIDTDTVYQNLYWNKGDLDKENRKGRILNEFRDSFFIDNIFALVPFNPELTSGTKIKLEIPFTKNDPSMLSRRFTGEYLALLTEHVWSNDDKMAYTKLFLGRRNTDALASSAQKLDLFGGA